MDEKDFVEFLIHAKRATYASGSAPSYSSRPASHDLHYSAGDYSYIDSYLGGFHFIGEEAVWKGGTPVWGMNYYGKMLVEEVPAGFGDFLKTALLLVPSVSPYRGPDEFIAGEFLYRCQCSGRLAGFQGEEEITQNGKLIYRLFFTGGEIRQ